MNCHNNQQRVLSNSISREKTLERKLEKNAEGDRLRSVPWWWTTGLVMISFV